MTILPEVGTDSSAVLSVVAVAVAALSFWNSWSTARKQRRIQTQDLLLKFDENVMDWGAECISEIAHLETILTIPEPDEFETLFKASLLKISALVDQGRFYLPNILKDGHGAEKHPAYKGHREHALDLLVEIYDWGMAYEHHGQNDYAGARAVYRIRRKFVAELTLILDTRSRKDMLAALARSG